MPVAHLPRVPVSKRRERVDVRQTNPSEVDQESQPTPQRSQVHDGTGYADGVEDVKREDRLLNASVENEDVAAHSPAGSPIAARVRARLRELGISESDAAKALGRDRTVVSTLLRRLDAGHPVTTSTLRRLEPIIGRTAEWMVSGEEPAGVRLDACPGWEEAVRLARERYGLTSDQVERVAACRFPAAPRHVDVALVRAISDAL